MADDFGIRANIRFGREVTEARYNEMSGQWDVAVVRAAGEREMLHADLLFSCVGAFNKPRVPDVRGLDRFAGPSVIPRTTRMRGSTSPGGRSFSSATVQVRCKWRPR